MHYLEFLRTLHEKKRPQWYLEIGIRAGKSLRLAKCNSIGVDPKPQVTESIPMCTIYSQTSDDFFKDHDVLAITGGHCIDIAFIDGLHLSEFAFRDFINISRFCSKDSLIVFDDVLPRNMEEASRKPTGRAWTGDVYKVILFLMTHEFLDVSVVDTTPTGLAIVRIRSPDGLVRLRNSTDAIVELLRGNELRIASVEGLHQRMRCLKAADVLEGILTP